MTSEEAIRKLQNFADHAYPNEEFVMAIKALEQDCISRQAVKEMIFYEAEGWPTDEEVALLKRLMKHLDTLPSVTPKEPCEDCISRQSVKEPTTDAEWEKRLML